MALFIGWLSAVVDVEQDFAAQQVTVARRIGESAFDFFQPGIEYSARSFGRRQSTQGMMNHAVPSLEGVGFYEPYDGFRAAAARAATDARSRSSVRKIPSH